MKLIIATSQYSSLINQFSSLLFTTALVQIRRPVFLYT